MWLDVVFGLNHGGFVKILAIIGDYVRNKNRNYCKRKEIICNDYDERTLLSARSIHSSCRVISIPRLSFLLRFWTDLPTT